jgi:hypothetical protein
MSEEPPGPKLSRVEETRYRCLCYLPCYRQCLDFALYIEANLTAILAVWGAVVSTIAIAWNIARDLSDRAKLHVICYVGQVVIPLGPKNTPLVLIWRVTNSGRKPAVLTHIGGALENGGHFMINTTELPRTLQPGDYYLGHSADLSILKKNPTALWAIDSLNRHWKIPNKMLRALLEQNAKPS